MKDPSGVSKLKGIWIASPGSCAALEEKLNSLVDEIGGPAQPVQQESTPAPVNVMELLSKAHQRRFSEQDGATSTGPQPHALQQMQHRSLDGAGDALHLTDLTSRLNAVLGLDVPRVTAGQSTSAGPTSVPLAAQRHPATIPGQQQQQQQYHHPHQQQHQHNPQQQQQQQQQHLSNQAALPGPIQATLTQSVVAQPTLTQQLVHGSMSSQHINVTPSSTVNQLATQTLPSSMAPVKIPFPPSHATTHRGDDGGGPGDKPSNLAKPHRPGKADKLPAGVHIQPAVERGSNTSHRRSSAPGQASAQVRLRSNTAPIPMGTRMVRAVDETTGGPRVVRMKSVGVDEASGSAVSRHQQASSASSSDSTFHNPLLNEVSTSAPGSEYLMRPCEFDGAQLHPQASLPAGSSVQFVTPLQDSRHTVHTTTSAHQMNLARPVCQDSPTAPAAAAVQRDVDSGLDHATGIDGNLSPPCFAPLTLEQFRIGLLQLARNDDLLQPVYQTYVDTMHSLHTDSHEQGL
ncbi:uncharacterized protein LOC135809175 isoform X2 [Sycon ciliatum]|uniref:uncharacterized protein LOC135809175 isoform X2 n=1 Tax=Sycon ciliatum TaxID=27933 RepID=UPI0031F69849